MYGIKIYGRDVLKVLPQDTFIGRIYIRDTTRRGRVTLDFPPLPPDRQYLFSAYSYNGRNNITNISTEYYLIRDNKITIGVSPNDRRVVVMGIVI